MSKQPEEVQQEEAPDLLAPMRAAVQALGKEIARVAKGRGLKGLEVTAHEVTECEVPVVTVSVVARYARPDADTTGNFIDVVTATFKPKLDWYKRPTGAFSVRVVPPKLILCGGMPHTRSWASRKKDGTVPVEAVADGILGALVMARDLQAERREQQATRAETAAALARTLAELGMQRHGAQETGGWRDTPVYLRVELHLPAGPEGLRELKRLARSRFRLYLPLIEKPGEGA
jgi:hypothetical protein